MKGVRLLWERFSDWLVRASGLILFLAAWEAVPRLKLIRSVLLSPPSKVARAFISLAVRGELYKHFSISLQRVVIGLLLSVLVGVLGGLLLACFRRAEKCLDLLFQFFRQMSAFALFPVFILFFGLGELSKTIIIFWASFWPVLLNTSSGIKNVDPVLIKSAYSMGASRGFIFRRVILPAAAPQIFTGIRLGGSYCVMAVVAAEMIGATAGLGYLVLYSQETFNIAEMYAGIVGLAFLGLGLNWVLQRIESYFTSWQEGQKLRS